MAASNFVSIQDFAKLAHVSSQAVYARYNSLDKSLIKTESGKKYISTSAISLFMNSQHKQDNKEPLSGVEQVLLRQIETLEKQLSAKDSQIDNLQKEIHQRNDEIKELHNELNSLSDLSKGLTKLQENSQYLIAMAQNSIPAGSDSESKEESPDTVPPPPTQAPEQAPTEEQHGFFWRLFH